MVKHPPERKTHCSTLEAYKETPIFILVDIMEDVSESATRKLSGITWTDGTYSEALQMLSGARVPSPLWTQEPDWDSVSGLGLA